MLIRCKSIRKLPPTAGNSEVFGSNIDLTPKGETTKKVLQFRPLDPKSPDADHVCDVNDADDIATLLAIREGFEVHPSALGKTVAKAALESGTATPPAQVGAGDAKAPPPPAEDTRTQKELLGAVAAKTGKKPSPATSRKKLLELLAA